MEESAHRGGQRGETESGGTGSLSQPLRKHILEGYSATETTPVASVNLPDCLDTQYWDLQIGSKTGSVGMPLPGSSVRIVDPRAFERLPTGN